MNAPQHRILLIVGALLLVGAISGLVAYALNSNLAYYYSPSEVLAGQAPRDKVFRMGGLVQEGSLKREADGLGLRFVLTDQIRHIEVRFRGIPPDLFREGRGAVVQGRLGDEGIFLATEVLAKHDENYLPPGTPQVAKDAHQQSSRRPVATK